MREEGGWGATRKKGRRLYSLWCPFLSRPRGLWLSVSFTSPSHWPCTLSDQQGGLWKRHMMREEGGWGRSGGGGGGGGDTGKRSSALLFLVSFLSRPRGHWLSVSFTSPSHWPCTLCDQQVRDSGRDKWGGGGGGGRGGDTGKVVRFTLSGVLYVKTPSPWVSETLRACHTGPVPSAISRG